MIQSLKERFGLSEIQAHVIFYQLQNHFLKNTKNDQVYSDQETNN
jgi:hypothetical protein